MISFGFLIIYLNYLIPNKISILKNLKNNFSELSSNFIRSMTYVYEIFLAVFIIFSVILALLLILGSFLRMLKVLKRKTKRIEFQ